MEKCNGPTVFEQAQGFLGAAAIALKAYNDIEVLRQPEGACVRILCDNPEGSGPDNAAVEISSDWTDWKPRRFTGHVVADALHAAREAMRYEQLRRALKPY